MAWQYPAAIGATLLANKVFSGNKPNLYDESFFNERINQISEFDSKLASARTKYLTSLNNMYNDAYTRFTANAEPGFASRGLSVSGGAFATALANKAAEFQAQLTPLAFQAEREDLGAVDSARAGLFSQKAGAKFGAAGREYDNYMANQRAVGQFAGTLATQWIGGMGSEPKQYNNYGGGSGGFGPSGYRTGTMRNGRAVWD